MDERALLRMLLGAGRGWIAATCALLAATWLSGIALLALSGWFITATALSGAGVLAGLNIFTPSAGIRAAAVARTLARYGERVVGHEAVLRILASLRTQSFARIAALPPARLREVRSGDWQTRLSADIDTLDAVPLKVVAPWLAAGVSVLAAIALAALLAPPAAPALLGGTALLVVLASLLAARRGARFGRDLVQQRAAERVAVLDHVGGLAELTAYGRADPSRQSLAALDRAQSQRVHTQAMAEQMAEQAVQALVALSSLMLLLLALSWFAAGIVSGPVAALLALMALGLNEALSSLPAASWRIGESREAARRLVQLAPGAATPGPAAADVDAPGPAARAAGDTGATERARGLRVAGVVVGHVPGRGLCAPLDLRLEPGLPLLLHGPSGVGKSSLLATLAGELEALAGSVWLDGDPLLTMDDAERVARVALLPQDTLLVAGRVIDNLRLARPGLRAAPATAVLGALGLAEYGAGGSRGLAYWVGEGGRRLSGGQARRLALAWLMLREPRLALLDEPFAGLDAGTEAQVMQALGPWLESRLAVVVSHTPERFPAHWPRLALAPA